MENRKQSNNRDNRERMETMMETMGREFPVHSQVRKIREESDTTIDWKPGQPEIRPAAFRDMTRQISRSPLGISGRPISVGDS